MTKYFLVIFAVSLCIGWAAAQAPYQGSYEMLRQFEKSKNELSNPGLALFDSTHSYDAIHYTLRIDLNEPSDNIRKGHVTMTAVANSALDSIDMHMISMTVDSVRYNGNPATYRRRSGKVWVLTPQLGQGDTFTVDIIYHGFPSSGLYFASTRYGEDHTYSMVEPADARYWWPCYDEPWDKATCDVYCTVDSGRTVIANGRLIEIINEGNNRFTWHWRENHPITTYLISIAVARYAKIIDYAHVGSDTILIEYYAYPQDSAAVAYDLAYTPNMVEFYSNQVVPYPFANEKYAVVQAAIFNGWGAMEHQTCTTYGHSLITGDRRYEWIDAHELAHMWFGDLVTMADWRHIWLNESFATYFDALYTEYRYGYNAFQQRRANFLNAYLNEDSQRRYAIYDPPSGYLFGACEYEKGALVLHMLRRLLGDQNFFAAIRNYANQYAYGNASTDELKAHFENFYGDLDWFFYQWIYQPGHPEYLWNWYAQDIGGQHPVSITIHQTQSNAPIFKMPIKFKATFPGGSDTTFVLWDSLPSQYFTVFLNNRPNNLIFDPENDLIKEVDQYTEIGDNGVKPAFLELSQNYPNPFNSSTQIEFYLEQDSPVRLEIFDITGALVKKLVSANQSAGKHKILWDGTNSDGKAVGSGVYIYRLDAAGTVSAKKMNLIR